MAQLADLADYTRGIQGVYVPREVDTDGGIYILDSNNTAAGVRSTEVYDNCTRDLRARGQGLGTDQSAGRPLVHPRSYPDGQDYPGIGAGRREGFHSDAEPFLNYPGAAQDYAAGNRGVGRPGFRSTTSSRVDRAAVDYIGWDNRPPHYSPWTDNEDAHLFLNPAWKGGPVPGMGVTPGEAREAQRIFETMQGGKAAKPVKKEKARAKPGWAQSVSMMNLVIFVIIVVLLAIWLVINGAIGRLRESILCSLREAILLGRVIQRGPAPPVATSTAIAAPTTVSAPAVPPAALPAPTPMESTLS